MRASARGFWSVSSGNNCPPLPCMQGTSCKTKSCQVYQTRTATFACQLARTKNACKARQGGKAWSRHCTLSSLQAQLSALHRPAYRNASLATRRSSGYSHWLHNANRDSCQKICRSKAASGSVKLFWSMWAMTWQRLIVSHSYDSTKENILLLHVSYNHQPYNV